MANSERVTSGSLAGVGAESEIVLFHRALGGYSKTQLTDDVADRVTQAGVLMKLIRLDLAQEKQGGEYDGPQRIGNLRAALNTAWQGLGQTFLAMFLRQILMGNDYGAVNGEVRNWFAGLTLFKNLYFFSSSDLYDVCLPVILAANQPWFNDLLFDANSMLIPDHDAFQPYFLFLTLASYHLKTPLLNMR